MATATLGSVTLSSPSTSWAAGSKWIERARVGARIYGRTHPDAAGDDGTGRKNFGFRRQAIVLTCRFVESSGAAAIAAAAAAMNALTTAGTFSVTYGGVSFGTGELDSEGTYFSEEHGLAGSGRYFVDLILAVTIIRLT